MSDLMRIVPATAPAAPAPVAPPGIAQVTDLLSQTQRALGHVHPSGPVTDAHHGIRPAQSPGHSIQTLLDQVRSLLPTRPSAISVPRDTVLQRPEDLMRPGKDQKGMLRGALNQLVQYERMLGIQQPPIDPKMPLDAQFANIDKRYNGVRHQLNLAMRGERELPQGVNAGRVYEVLDLAKERLAGVGFESSWTNSGHVRHPGLIAG